MVNLYGCARCATPQRSWVRGNRSGCMCCLSVWSCVFIYFIFHYLLFFSSFLGIYLFYFFLHLIYVVTGPEFETCCPLACLWCYHWGVSIASPRCSRLHPPLGTSWLPGHLARGTGACAGPLCLAVWGALSGIEWGLCRGVWGRSGSWGLGLAHGPCLGGRGLAGSVGCCPWFLGSLCPMLMGALSVAFLCSLLGGCVVVPTVGFPGSVLCGGCWWPGSCGTLCLLLIVGGVVDIGPIHLYTHN